MILKRKQFKHRISISFLLILTVSSVLFVIPLIPNNSVNNINDKADNDKEGLILPVLSNGIGEEEIIKWGLSKIFPDIFYEINA